MRARDMALAALTSAIWGFGFVVGKVGLESFSPAQLTAVRFLVACLPIVLVPRPTISWMSIVLIGSTIGADLKPMGLGLAAAFSWAIGNVLVKRLSDVPMFPLVVWCSLVPPLPAMLVSGAYDRHLGLVEAMASASWLGIGAVVYLGGLATVLAYATWGYLLQRYSTGVVAPFALLAPCTGVVSSAVIFGEAFTPMRYVGMALIVGGLAIIVLRRRS